MSDKTENDVKPRPTLGWMVKRLIDHRYDGGVNGTCYECPFASRPLDRAGREALWGEISNDPTEAYFRCSLPGRDHDKIAWGEYAPCTQEEWADEIQRRLDLRFPPEGSGAT